MPDKPSAAAMRAAQKISTVIVTETVAYIIEAEYAELIKMAGYVRDSHAAGTISERHREWSIVMLINALSKLEQPK